MASNRRVDGSRLSIGALCHVHTVVLGPSLALGVGLYVNPTRRTALSTLSTRAAEFLESLIASCPGPETLVAIA